MADDKREDGSGRRATPAIEGEDADPLQPAIGLKGALRSAFDRSFWVFFCFAVVAGLACWFVNGRHAFFATLAGDVRLIADILPRILAAVSLAALVQVLIPRQAIAQALGDEAGLKGVALAAGAGALTPGGPMTSFPLVNALHAAGSGRASLVAYLTSWSVLGLQRILTWEVPLMGLDFAIVRFVASLPLPFVAAAVTRLMPQPPRDAKP